MQKKEFEIAKCKNCNFKKRTFGMHKGHIEAESIYVAKTLMMFDRHSKCCKEPNYFTAF